MKAIVFEGPKQLAVRDIPIPALRPGWTLVRVSHAGICGSDQTILAGRHPRARAPLVLGHEISGTVASPHPTLPEGTLVAVYPFIACGTCERCRVGQFHVCKTLKVIGIDLDGGMAEYILVPETHLVPVQAGIPPQLAAYIEPIAISVHAARQGNYKPGDPAIVFGAGGIGLSVAITLRHFGAKQIIVCERDPARLDLARSMGFDTVESSPDTLKQLYDRTNGDGAEFVFDCAGHQSVIDILPDAVKINGTIVLVAGYKIPPQMDFQKGMFREFDIRFVRNSARRDFEIAGSLAAQDPDYGRLLNCILPIDEARRGFDVPAGAIKVMFSMTGEG